MATAAITLSLSGVTPGRAQNLTPFAAAEVDAMLKSAKPPAVSMPVWSQRDDRAAAYRRNPQVWSGSRVDLSGKAIWNSCTGTFGVTAISPLHVVYAAHVHGLYPAGTAVRFVTSGDRVVDREIVKSASISGTDIEISTLDVPLPPDVHWFKVMPRYWFLKCARRMSGSVGGIPCIILDDNTQSVAVKEAAGFSADAFYVRDPMDPVRKPFTRELYGGDSGCPLFVLLGGELVLDGIFHWAVGGSELSSHIAELDAAMAGTPYQVTVFDVTPYGR